jgi:hypothetical protein
MLYRLFSHKRSASILFGAAVVLFIPMATRASGQTSSTPEDRAAYNKKIAKDYTYRYGADHPFLPSNITTDNGEFIDPKSFATAQYCQHCIQTQTAHPGISAT